MSTVSSLMLVKAGPHDSDCVIADARVKASPHDWCPKKTDLYTRHSAKLVFFGLFLSEFI